MYASEISCLIRKYPCVWERFLGCKPYDDWPESLTEFCFFVGNTANSDHEG